MEGELGMQEGCHLEDKIMSQKKSFDGSFFYSYFCFIYFILPSLVQVMRLYLCYRYRGYKINFWLPLGNFS